MNCTTLQLTYPNQFLPTNQPDAIYPTDPEAYRYMVLYVITICLVLGQFLLFAFFHQQQIYERIRVRPLHLMFVTCFGGLIQVQVEPLAGWVGKLSYPCVALFCIHMLVVPTIGSALVARIFQQYFGILFQNQLHQEQGLLNDVDLEDILMLTNEGSTTTNNNNNNNPGSSTTNHKTTTSVITWQSIRPILNALKRSSTNTTSGGEDRTTRVDRLRTLRILSFLHSWRGTLVVLAIMIVPHIIILVAIVLSTPVYLGNCNGCRHDPVLFGFAVLQGSIVGLIVLWGLFILRYSIDRWNFKLEMMTSILASSVAVISYLVFFWGSTSDRDQQFSAVVGMEIGVILVVASQSTMQIILSICFDRPNTLRLSQQSRARISQALQHLHQDQQQQQRTTTAVNNRKVGLQYQEINNTNLGEDQQQNGRSGTGSSSGGGLVTSSTMNPAFEQQQQQHHHHPHQSISSSQTESYSEINLLNALDNPELCKLFETFLTQEMSLENLMFFRDVSRWEREFFDLDKGARLARARKIMRTYIVQNSMLSVNLPSEIWKDILTRVERCETKPDGESLPRTLFSIARQEILELLLRGPWFRFVKSKPYLDYQVNINTSSAAAATMEAGNHKSIFSSSSRISQSASNASRTSQTQIQTKNSRTSQTQAGGGNTGGGGGIRILHQGRVSLTTLNGSSSSSPVPTSTSPTVGSNNLSKQNNKKVNDAMISSIQE
jgi:hypothetical protein